MNTESNRVRDWTLPHAGVVLAVVLVLSLLTIVAAPAAVAQDAQNGTINETANESTANETGVESGPYALEELRNGGREIPGADPSMRWVGQTGSVFVDYPSADPLSPKAEDWEVQNVLESGSLVKRDELTVNAQRERGAPDETYVLKVVTYQTEHVEITDENGEKRQERAAVDQSVHEHELHFSGAFDRESISLPNTDGDRRQVAMWLEDETGKRVDGASWTFEHKSTPTSTDAGISTMGDLFGWVGLFVLLPGFVGIPLSSRLASKIHDITGKGPMLSAGFYIGLAFVLGLLVLLFAWIQFAQFITRLPLMLGVSVVILSFVIFLERGGNDVQRVQFTRDELGDAISPNGDDVQDTIYQETADVRMARLDEDGRYVILRKGIRPFLARLFGVAPVLDVSDLSTQIDMETVSVAKGEPWDRKFIADPTADAPLDWAAPQLTFPLTEADDDLSGLDRLAAIRWVPILYGGFGALFGHVLAKGLLGLPLAGLCVGGLVAFAVAAGRVEDGYAEFEAAPVHYTSARPQVLQSASDLADAKTIDDLEDIALEATTETALEARRISSRMDSTVSQTMTERELGLGADDDRADDEREPGQDDDGDRADDDRGDDQGDESDETSLVVRGD